LRYLRMVPFFAIIVTPLLAEWFSALDGVVAWLHQVFPARETLDATGKPLLNAIVLLCLLFGALLSIPQIRLSLSNIPATTLIADNFPLDASDYLADRITPDTRLFNMSEWGGYLIWRLYPQAQVFVDGRIELYPVQVWDDYLQIAQANEGWQERLRAHQVDYLVLSTERHGQLIASAEKAGWRCVYQDPVAVIFARQDKSY